MFIYDMAGSQYTNFELDLSKKILNLLKVLPGGWLVSGDSVWATRSPRTQSPVVLASICTSDHTDHVSAEEQQLQPRRTRGGHWELARLDPAVAAVQRGREGSAVPGLDSSHSCWQHFWESRCKLFFHLLAFGASSLLRKKKSSKSKYWPGCVLRIIPVPSLLRGAKPSLYLIPRK